MFSPSLARIISLSFFALFPPFLDASQLPLARSVVTGVTPFPTDLCAINAWPTEQQGLPYTPQLPDSELTEILNQVDPQRIRAYVEKLVGFGTRHTLSVQDDPVRGKFVGLSFWRMV